MLEKRKHGLGRLAVAAVATLATVSTASADDGYRKLPIPTPPTRVHSYVIVAEQPDARVVTKYSRDHLPTPEIVPVNVLHQTHAIDIDANYLRSGHYRIDDNHWIIQSQRLARSYYGGKARVVYGATPAEAGEDAELASIQPRLIIQKPDGLRPNHTRPRQEPSPRKPGQWVRAE